jgi:hypothetical protein
MLKKLSGLSDEKLEYYLARVKEISNLGHEAAIIEVDKLIWEIVDREEIEIDLASSDKEDLEYQVKEAEDEMEEFIRDMNDLKRDVRRGAVIDQWVVDNLRDSLENLCRDYPDEVVSRLASRLKEVRDQASSLVAEAGGLAKRQLEEAERQRHLDNLEEALNRTIYNFSSVQAIISSADQAVSYFQKSGILTDDLKEKVRVVKKRAAWFRARKKLDEAETLIARGSKIKPEGATREAKALLKQDWRLAFPKENPPTIN